MYDIPKYFKLLVTGGRKYNNTALVYKTLDRIVEEFSIKDLILIHGRASGADALARMWAKDREYQDRGYPAQWKRHSTTGGPVRNMQMLEEENPDLVVVFPGGHGTAHMKHIAAERGYKVIEASTW